MPFAAGVFDEDYLAGADLTGLAVARGNLNAGIEIDDVLPAWRRMPVEIVGRRHLAKDDAVGREPLRQFAAWRFLDPLDLDVAPMRLAVGVGIKIVDSHSTPPLAIAW